VRDPQKTSDELYNHIYIEEHLAHILISHQTKFALSYKDLDPSAVIPYITLYPVDNASTIGSTKVLQLIEDTNKERRLECYDIYDLIYFEIRLYEKV
jgi:hypothetical protein